MCFLWSRQSKHYCDWIMVILFVWMVYQGKSFLQMFGLWANCFFFICFHSRTLVFERNYTIILIDFEVFLWMSTSLDFSCSLPLSHRFVLHVLDCSDLFPVPEKLLPRVDGPIFWGSVISAAAHPKDFLEWTYDTFKWICFRHLMVFHGTWWFIPRIVSGLVHPSYKWTLPPLIPFITRVITIWHPKDFWQGEILNVTHGIHIIHDRTMWRIPSWSLSWSREPGICETVCPVASATRSSAVKNVSWPLKMVGSCYASCSKG